MPTSVRSALFLLLLFAAVVVPSFVLGQNPTPSNPQAVTLAAQSIAALTGGTNISDATLTGNVTWNSDADTGTFTLQALGTGESRMDLALASGTRTEIRDASGGFAQGRWITPSSSGHFAGQNCMTDAAWFFPALGSLAGETNVVLLYIGQESRNNATVQHIQSHIYQASPSPQPLSAMPTSQQLSTMDFYLDATTFLPVALTYNIHADKDSSTNIAVEVDFSDYQAIGSITVPMHIQQYVQRSLMIDLSITSESFNTGIPLSTFSIN